MRTEHLADGTKKVIYDPMRGRPFYGDWLTVLLARGAAHIITSIKDGQAVEKIVPLDRYQEQRAILDEETGNTGIICVGCGEPVWSTVHEAFKRVSEVKITRGGRLKKIIATNITAQFTDRIRIGGFIQFPNEERLSSKEIHVKWAIRPVMKMGLGCATCHEKYEQLIREANEANEVREGYANLLAEIAVNGSAAQARRELQVAQIKNAVRTKCLHGMIEVYCAVCVRNKGLALKEPSVTEVKLPSPVQPFIDVFAKDALDVATVEHKDA